MLKGMNARPSVRPERRALLVGAIYGLWGLITAAFAAPAIAYLFLPPTAKREQEWADAGELRNLPPNVPEEVVFRRTRIDGWKISSQKATAWVVKQDGDRIVAFSPQCTHLGCAVHWDERNKNFLCPCHTSSFGIDGRVLGGPAPRSLDRFHVRVAGGKLQIGPLETPPQES
jgi:menaquinol-cytochrome c reductase iron-sulfur subunit